MHHLYCQDINRKRWFTSNFFNQSSRYDSIIDRRAAATSTACRDVFISCLIREMMVNWSLWPAPPSLVINTTQASWGRQSQRLKAFHWSQFVDRWLCTHAGGESPTVDGMFSIRLLIHLWVTQNKDVKRQTWDILALCVSGPSVCHPLLFCPLSHLIMNSSVTSINLWFPNKKRKVPPVIAHCPVMTAIQHQLEKQRSAMGWSESAWSALTGVTLQVSKLIPSLNAFQFLC